MSTEQQPHVEDISTPVVTFDVGAPTNDAQPGRIATDLSDHDFVGTPAPVTTLGEVQPPTIDVPDTSNTVDQNAQPEQPADPNKPADDSAQPSENENDDEGSPNYDDYSVTSKFGIALKESGLDMFGEEIPQDLKPQDFVAKTNEVIQLRADRIADQKMQQYGNYAEYMKFMIQGGDYNAINPAVQAQQYADFDVDGADVSSDQLEAVVRAMYEKQVSGADPDVINSLIAIDKDKNLLKDKAVKSVGFHKTFIETTKNTARETFEANQRAEQRRIQDEASNFAHKLKSTNEVSGIQINEKDRAAIYDQMWKRDQPYNYVDEEGNNKQEFLTKYEVAMYNIVNNPEKLILLNHLILNDFNLEGVKQSARNNVSRSIFDSIEGGQRQNVTAPTVTTPAQARQEEEANVVSSFDVT